jgi:hypothetical protein
MEIVLSLVLPQFETGLVAEVIGVNPTCVHAGVIAKGAKPEREDNEDMANPVTASVSVLMATPPEST